MSQFMFSSTVAFARVSRKDRGAVHLIPHMRGEFYTLGAHLEMRKFTLNFISIDVCLACCSLV